MENVKDRTANVFFWFFFYKHEKGTECLALWEGSEKGKEGGGVRSIT